MTRGERTATMSGWVAMRLETDTPIGDGKRGICRRGSPERLEAPVTDAVGELPQGRRRRQPVDAAEVLGAPVRGELVGCLLRRPLVEVIAFALEAHRGHRVAARRRDPRHVHANDGADAVTRREASRQAREPAVMQSEIAREQSRISSGEVREMARMQSEIALEQARIATTVNGMAYAYRGDAGLATTMPRAWAQSDPADSLYKAAMDVMNKGDYRKAATLLKEIPVKFQYSQYAAEAMYWQAHALYRVGGTPDLQEALPSLETRKTK